MNIFDRLFKSTKKKTLNIETRQTDGWSLMSIAQLVQSAFPTADKDNKLSLMRSCSGFVYALTSMIANDCALVPIRLMSKRGNNKLRTRNIDNPTKDYLFSKTSGLKAKVRDANEVVEVVEHKALTLLDEMNDYDDGINILSDTESHLLLIGNAYWYIPTGLEDIEPARIHLLQSDQVTIETDKTQFRTITGYKYSPIAETLTTKEIIRFKYSNPADWLYGASPLQAAIDYYNIGGNLGALLKELSKNKNGMDLFLSSPPGSANLTDTQIKQYKEQFKNYRLGNIKMDEIMVLDNGMQLLSIPNLNKDLPFIENLKGIFKFICWTYGVPDSLLNQEGSWAGQPAKVRQYYNSVIKPKLIRRQSVLNSSYITKFKDYESAGLFIMIDDPVPIDNDLLIKQTGIIITQNEAREAIKRDSIDGADILYMPSGMVATGQDAAEQGKAFAEAVLEKIQKGIK